MIEESLLLIEILSKIGFILILIALPLWALAIMYFLKQYN